MTEKQTVTVSKTIKARLVAGIAAQMKADNVSKSALAQRMKTSRAVVYRLLDPRDTSMTLATLGKAAVALGAKVAVTVG